MHRYKHVLNRIPIEFVLLYVVYFELMSVGKLIQLKMNEKFFFVRYQSILPAGIDEGVKLTR
jgi:hypothetical protein